jgi:sugar (pentulose or hexulose) kinase
MNINQEKAREEVKSGNAVLGIEFGSTRIKAVLIGKDNEPIASGGHGWQNELIDNIWTYSLEDVFAGVQAAYRDMVDNVKKELGVEVERLGALGFSGMMHGYIALDKDNNLLTPFRTWRNNITSEASKALTELFNYPIPQRWSIVHLYQCILNGDEHVSRLDFLTTLAGFVHWKLTGKKVLGVGEASGAFPIDIKTKDYNKRMLKQFDELVSDKKFDWKIENILPKVLDAGQNAGELTEEGALLLDPSGRLKAGAAVCPPEGDAGTGMVATNSISVRTGNVSAGTSVFACIVLEDDLSKAYSEIDQVTTPHGKLVAMSHSNNCTSDLNAWIEIFDEATKALGFECSKTKLFETLYNLALQGDAECGGLLSYAYISGEHMTHFEEGRPLFARSSDSNFTLANFMRVHLFTALGAMRMGLDILFKQESVEVDEIVGHGGLFKTKGVGQKIMAGVTNTPVTVMETADEGGAWGIALLASYMVNKGKDESLDDFLKQKVFINRARNTIDPDPNDVEGYNTFMKRYAKGLDIERAAVECLN